MEDQSKQLLQRFATTLGSSIAKAIEETNGTALQIKVLDAEDAPTSAGARTLFRLTAAGALRGEFFLDFSETQAAQLAGFILGTSVPKLSESAAESLAAVLSSAAEGLATSLASTHGQITIHLDRPSTNPADHEPALSLILSAPGQPDVSARLFADSQLIKSLSSPAAIPNGKVQTAAGLGNLKMVLDVELNVTLRFGQRQLPLRDVLELTSGSVVELDSKVDDPIELLLDGKVIARGEAVIVDGNYGLRVTEIPQPLASHFGG